MKKPSIHSLFTAGIAAAVLALSGCSSDETETVDSGASADSAVPMTDSGMRADSAIASDGGADSATGDAGEALARVRVIHLSPDAPAVSVYANDGATPVVATLAFPAGTDYLEVPAASYDFDVAPAGMGPSNSVLAVDDVELSGGESYTVVAYGLVASGSATPLSALALVDDASPVGSGMIRVRAIHAAAGVGQVDIWNVPMAGSPTPVFENLDYGAASNATMLPAGAYTLGLDANNDGTPEFTFTTPALQAGAILNVFAVAPTSGNPYLIAQFADSTTARIDAN